jgi:hypothetical protein
MKHRHSHMNQSIPTIMPLNNADEIVMNSRIEEPTITATFDKTTSHASVVGATATTATTATTKDVNSIDAAKKHLPPDRSMHVILPPTSAAEVIRAMKELDTVVSSQRTRQILEQLVNGKPAKKGKVSKKRERMNAKTKSYLHEIRLRLLLF